jgi:hypothetical protein
VENGIIKTVYITARHARPSVRSKLPCQSAQGGLILSWDAVADPDIDYYLLKFSANTSDTWNKMTEMSKVYGTSVTLPAALSGKYAVQGRGSQ